MAQCVSAVKANTIFTATENAEERSTPTSSSAWSRGRLFLRIAIGCRSRKAELGHAGLCLRLRQTRIGAKALSWCASITVGSRMWRLNVTVLEQSEPTIEAYTTFLRTEDAPQKYILTDNFTKSAAQSQVNNSEIFENRGHESA